MELRNLARYQSAKQNIVHFIRFIAIIIFQCSLFWDLIFLADLSVNIILFAL